MAKKNKVLLIGWDAADWKIIDKLMDAGLMPAMKRVVDNGVRGRLATLDPPLSPMLWTSMATGVRPYKHGVIGFVEHDGTGGVRPISSHGRKVKAFWNMFTMEGMKTNVVGWWPSNPVESINGVMVSNLFQQEKKGKETISLEDWTIPPGTIHPESFEKQLAELRIHPSEITGNLVMPFVPQAVELDKKEDKRLTVITKFLAHSASLHAVTTELMEETDWDITAVYHDAIDHFSHAFMKFNPPKMDGIEEDMYVLFKDVVKGAYVYHDMMLERLLNLIDDETTVVIVSDHGFHSDHLRPRYVPQVPSGPAIEHAPYGIFVAMGPGIKKGERIYGANVLDVTPTLLSLFDLPVGRDMDGKPLVEIFTEPKEIKYIDSWENDPREGGKIVVQESTDELTAEAALQQLIDLGYIDDLKIEEGADADETRDRQLKATLKENNFYLAKAYASGGQYEEALEILLEIEDRKHPDYRYLIEIINAAVKTKRFALAEEYISFIRKNDLITDNYMNLLEAQVRIGLNEPAKALKLLETGVNDFPDAPNILVDFGKLLNVLHQSERAREMFLKSLQLDPDNPYAHHGVGVAALRSENYEEALEYFLNAIDIYYHYPFAHFHLGETLSLLKKYEEAIKSFEVVVSMAPGMIKAYKWLYDLHDIIGDDEKKEYYKELISKFDKGERILITGLPGRKLNETIAELQNQGLRIAGADDLLGDQINVLDKSWMDDRRGDLVYVPLNFIGSIPVKFSYRILYVNDNFESVMMFLNKLDRLKENTFNQKVLEGLQHQESVAQTWLSQQPSLDIVYINDTEDLKKDIIRSFYSQSAVS